MKALKELKKMWDFSTEELKKEISASSEALLKLRFQKVVDEMVDKSVIKKTRKKIARLKTILRSKELEKPGK